MDQDNLKQLADEVLSTVAEKASKAAEVAGKAASKASQVASDKAGDYSQRALKISKQSIDAATPVVQQWIDQATPVVQQWVDQAQDQAKALADASKVNAADAKQQGLATLAELAAKGQETLADVEKHARAAAAPPAVKKHGRAGRVFGWTAAAAGAASVAYLLWRRSRPIEDPWAEEYWVDLQSDDDLSDIPEEPVEAIQDGLAEAKDQLEEAVEEATS